MTTVAVAMVCKTPTAGQSKTRLSPPLTAEQCAALSGCFIRDVAATIGSLVADGDVADAVDGPLIVICGGRRAGCRTGGSEASSPTTGVSRHK